MATEQHPLAAFEDTGALPTPDPDDLDSRCDECTHQVQTLGEDLPKREAVTWVQGPDAIRRYLCREHVEDLLRYGTSPDLEHPDASAPTAERCRGCGTWTLKSDLADPAGKRCPDCV